MQPLEQLNTCHLRHVVISNQQVVVIDLKRLPSVGPILGSISVVAGVNQRARDQPADGGLVIHHQNTMGRIHPARQGGAIQLIRWLDASIVHFMKIALKTLPRYGVFSHAGVARHSIRVRGGQ